VTDRPSHDPSGEKDQVKPFHAKEVSSGQETADAVAAVLKHAAARDEAAKKKAPPKKQPRWMLPLGLNLSLLAVYLIVFSPTWVQFNPIQSPPTAERMEDLRAAMAMYSAKIDNFLRANGHVPASLSEAGISVSGGLDYTPRGDSSYVLIGNVGEETLVYDPSQQSLQDFAPNLSRKIGG